MKIWAINENWETIKEFNTIEEAELEKNIQFQILYRESENHPVGVLFNLL